MPFFATGAFEEQPGTLAVETMRGCQISKERDSVLVLAVRTAVGGLSFMPVHKEDHPNDEKD